MKKSLFLILLIILAGAHSSYSQGILINEFQASNGSTVSDPDFGAYPDWIELFNTTDQLVDLGGWYLTDNLEDTMKWEIPAGVSLDPGAYLLIWADGEDAFHTAPHANFRLSITGDAIGLFSLSKTLVDSITFGKQSEDISSGRQPDGGSEWFFFDIPTP